MVHAHGHGYRQQYQDFKKALVTVSSVLSYMKSRLKKKTLPKQNTLYMDNIHTQTLYKIKAPYHLVE